MHRHRRLFEENNAQRIQELLDQVGNQDVDYDTWIKIGLGLKASLGDSGLDLWVSWSARSIKNNPSTTLRKWQSFHPREVSAGSIFYLLRGYQP